LNARVWKLSLVVILMSCESSTEPARVAPSNHAAPAAPTAPRLEWATDEAAAFARARELHRGVIAEGVATWANASKELDKLLHDDAVAAKLGGWIAYKVDVTKGDDVATDWQTRHGADTLPFVGFYDLNSEELGRIDRYVDRDEFLRRVPTRSAPR
jgi:thiol:disulfide interchange protein